MQRTYPLQLRTDGACHAPSGPTNEADYTRDQY